MPPLILTSRTPWRRRPSGLVEIDRSSPQARALYRWWTPPDTRERAFGQGGGLVITGGAPVPAGTLLGMGHNVGASAPMASPVANDFPSYQGTFAIWIRADFPSSTSGTYYEFCDSDTARHAFFMNETNQIVMYNDGRQTGFSGQSWSSGDVLHCVFAWDRTAGTQRLWINGVEKSGGAFGSWGSNLATGNFYLCQRYNGVQVMPCVVLDARLYSEAKSHDVWQLYAPETRWSLYAPIVRRAYFDLGGAGSSTPGDGSAIVMVL